MLTILLAASGLTPQTMTTKYALREILTTIKEGVSGKVSS